MLRNESFYETHAFHDGQWEWWDVQLESSSDPRLAQLSQLAPEAEIWVDMLPDMDVDFLTVRFPDGREPVMFGALQYSTKERLKSTRGCHHFYFFISKQRLITLNLDEQTKLTMLGHERRQMMNECKHGMDGMFVLIRTLLHYFHDGLDQFAKNLRELEELMHKHNRRTLMDRIVEARFELLYWSNLFAPFRELLSASREACLKELDDNPFFLRLLYRMERMEVLFERYEKEIDTMISMDNAISGFRGNEIMKTLTIVTTVFTPVMAVGAVWGMNFENLPWIQSRLGFTGVMLGTLLITAGMYYWMYLKGWTGDLLNNQRQVKGD